MYKNGEHPRKKNLAQDFPFQNVKEILSNDFSISFFFSRTQKFFLDLKKNSEIYKIFLITQIFFNFSFLFDAASDRTSVTAHLKIGILGF